MSSEAHQPPTSTEDAVETINEINLKLVKVLKKLLDPSFKLHNDDYLNLLLIHITQSKETRQIEVNNECLAKWINTKISHFEKSEEVNSNLITFALNITKYLCQWEEIFIQFNSNNIFDHVVNIVKRVNKPNVVTAFVRLLLQFMDHNAGLQWITSTSHWKYPVDIILEKETFPMGGNQFVSNLLEKSYSFDTAFCKIVIQYILAPLDDGKMMKEELTGTGRQRLLASFNLLSQVFTILRGADVILLFIEDFQLQKKIVEIISFVRDCTLKTVLYKTIILLIFYDLKLKCMGTERPSLGKTDILSTFLGMLYETANDIPVKATLQVLFTILNCWSNIKSSLPEYAQSNPLLTSVKDRLLAIQLTPIYTVFVKNVYTSDCEDKTRYRFISKLLDEMYPKTIRENYNWQSFLLDNYSIGNGILALKFFIDSRKFYSKENGILAFQMMVYLLQDLTVALKEKPELQIQFVNDPEYLELHLKVIDDIIGGFKLKFDDSREPLCVVRLAFNLLIDFVWPMKIVVAALKLAEIGISKYMNFQMTLVINDESYSVMSEMPYLLRAKLHDGAWEVRDSSIELIQSIFVNTNKSEFADYKKLIIEHDLPRSILRMITNDGNPFVRASALKCMQKAITIPEFWENIMEKDDFYATVLRILQMETEGIVRCEAASLVDCIYKYHNIPEEIMDHFYDTMSHTVIVDLHWEVRVNSLDFWRRVIYNHLSQEGMDGWFPNLTFSKELKETDNTEIEKRLVRILYKLSDVGCLSVFFEALQDECDMEVVTVATDHIKEFIGLIKHYKISLQSLRMYNSGTHISQTAAKIPLPCPPLCENYMRKCHPISDSIMEDILDTRDLHLLETVFNTSDEPTLENIVIKKRTVLPPEVFLNLINTNVEKHLIVKTKWANDIDSFQSLLDDILKEYEVTDVNSMDCY